MPRLLALDNRDSFTFTLVDYLRQAGAEVAVARSDALDLDAALAAGADGIMVSPGPGAPEDAGLSVALAAACVAARRPFLGVCLGHQALALACGSEVRRVAPMHGKIAQVRHDGSGLFAGLPSPLAMTRYHSLAVPAPRPPLLANAWSADGLCMGLRHAEAPAHGVQFHPESIASEAGRELISAFVALCAGETA
ncbi:anthranilate synthase component II [Sphingomicrobium astaxanthinifaciens]|uniref:anthranilate synthase component II n=1 Tax=Sphingomicrobium astaxanthinifaciens TaxID=1227949 RepID=UPI001FCB3D6B|nr:gamma-glutamyl-gamma-aminobutyrate hydrolase family protein [Sphingomicrobium astaxanthinifaciens]MCJ7422176.1 gamma-glutamyl-gamma-aminobutyrate hydrolase family protein [Sphingomicrobium astaxanthinifaciens]